MSILSLCGDLKRKALINLQNILLYGQITRNLVTCQSYQNKSLKMMNETG